MAVALAATALLWPAALATAATPMPLCNKTQLNAGSGPYHGGRFLKKVLIFEKVLIKSREVNSRCE
jgi:hypothetical protein